MQPRSLEMISADAMQLDPEQRAELAERLWLSVTDSDEHQAAWDVEIRQRIQRLERGEVKCRPWGEVLRELQSRPT